MKTETLLRLLVLCILILGAIYYFTPGEPGIRPASGQAPYTWRLTELGEHPGAPGVPRTGVRLEVDGKSYSIGEFDGSCFSIAESNWTLVPGEESGVICWFAGGGSEIGVFNESGRYTVKVGSLDEGSAETPGFRGDFNTVLEL